MASRRKIGKALFAGIAVLAALKTYQTVTTPIRAMKEEKGVKK